MKNHDFRSLRKNRFFQIFLQASSVSCITRRDLAAPREKNSKCMHFSIKIGAPKSRFSNMQGSVLVQFDADYLLFPAVFSLFEHAGPHVAPLAKITNPKKKLHKFSQIFVLYNLQSF